MLTLISITDERGDICAPQWLARSEQVHRQLRPHLEPDYAAKMSRVFAGGGRMCVAAEGEQVLGLGVYRIFENTSNGVKMYVDDLVTDESRRSAGVGHALMAHLQGIARAAGCVNYALDSGTHRVQAHKFYFREGMLITAFNFNKAL